MTKSDLKDGMIVVTKDDDTYLVQKSARRLVGIFGTDDCFSITDFVDDLTHKNRDLGIIGCDIVAVHTLSLTLENLNDPSELDKCAPIWRREEPKTLEERFTSLEEKVETLMNTLEDLK